MVSRGIHRTGVDRWLQESVFFRVHDVPLQTSCPLSSMIGGVTPACRRPTSSVLLQPEMERRPTRVILQLGRSLTMRKPTKTIRLSSRPRTVASDVAPEGDENGHLDEDSISGKR